jgi:hypothetical protein
MPKSSTLTTPYVGQKEVVRAEIAVHDVERRAVEVAQLVRVVEPGQRIERDAHPEARRHPGADLDHARHQLVEGLALEVFHHQIVAPRFDADLVGLHHVRVVEARDEAPLVEEHLAAAAVRREVFAQDLDDDQLLEPGRAPRERQVDVSHAAAPDALDEAKLAERGERLLVVALADFVALGVVEGQPHAGRRLARRARVRRGARGSKRTATGKRSRDRCHGALLAWLRIRPGQTARGRYARGGGNCFAPSRRK